MQFLTIAYGEPAAYDRTAPDIRNAAHDHDAWMVWPVVHAQP